MALAAVYRAARDGETAALELASARSAFERLGATADIARVIKAQAEVATPAATALGAAEAETPRAATP